MTRRQRRRPAREVSVPDASAPPDPLPPQEAVLMERELLQALGTLS